MTQIVSRWNATISPIEITRPFIHIVVTKSVSEEIFIGCVATLTEVVFENVLKLKNKIVLGTCSHQIQQNTYHRFIRFKYDEVKKQGQRQTDNS